MSGDPFQVLVVSPNAGARDLLAGTLAEGGVQPAVAAGPADAIEAAGGHAFDTALVDLFEGPDGFAPLRGLRHKLAASLPLLALTPKALVARPARAFDEGATDYVIKPCHKDEMLARVRAHATLGRALRHVSVAQETPARPPSRERLEMLGLAAGGVAHDLRNPLANIRNAIVQARMVAPRDETLDILLGIVEKQAVRADRMVGDLLDFTRARPPTRIPCPVAALVEEALAAVDLPPRIKLVRDLAEPGPALVDLSQIGRVLRNLVQNAVQAMTGPGTLSIRSAAGGDRVVLEVGDDGPGVPPGVRAKLFQPLQTTKASGTGLGLHVCKQLVEANGGTIELADTDKDRGATFRLRLPRA